MKRRPRGSITKWRGGYRVRLTTPDGRRESLGIHPTRLAAERILEAAVRTAKGSARRGATLAEYGERWLSRREAEGLLRTCAGDRARWRSRIATASFIDRELARLEPKAIMDWVRAELRGRARVPTKKDAEQRTRPIARQTVVNALALLRACLSSALADGLVKTNAAAGLRVPRKARTTESWTFLTRAEVDAVTSSSTLPERERLILTVAIFTGLRAGELWGLRWGDVHLERDRAELVVRHSYNGATKGGRVRRVPLLEPARLALLRWREMRPGVAAALVWPARHGGCHTRGYDARWRELRHEVGITRERVTFHCLRHTCASHLAMGTWTPRPLTLLEIKEWMGHASIATSERYSHLAGGTLLDVVRRRDDIGHTTDTPSKPPPSKGPK